MNYIISHDVGDFFLVMEEYLSLKCVFSWLIKFDLYQIGPGIK